MSVHKAELGDLSTDACRRSKCPAIVIRDSFPFDVFRHRASETWVTGYCQSTKCTSWVFVCAHFPSGAGVARVLPLFNELNAALNIFNIE